MRRFGLALALATLFGCGGGTSKPDGLINGAIDGGGLGGAIPFLGTGGANGGMGGTSGTANPCQPSLGDSACESCLKTSCCASLSACGANPACIGIMTCMAQCTTVACQTACKAANPAGLDAYSAYFLCSDTACKASCPPIGTSGAAGASGAGGARGTGGATGTPPGCEPAASDTACTTCLKNPSPNGCCTVRSACATNTSCVNLLDCLTNCTAGGACQDNCTATYPAGVTPLADYLDCADNTCTPPCGSTGAGGSAGAGGRAGTGGAGGRKGTGGSTGACGDYMADTPCGDCMEEKCCGPLTACATNTSCTNLLDCLVDCGSNATCQNTCVTTYPSGVTPLTNFLDCGESNCEPEPCGSTTGTGGRIGTGGRSGTGGRTGTGGSGTGGSGTGGSGTGGSGTGGSGTGGSGTGGSGTGGSGTGGSGTGGSTGASAKVTFCHGLVSSGNPITLVLTINGVQLSALTGNCSPGCTAVPVGTSVPFSLKLGTTTLTSGTWNLPAIELVALAGVETDANNAVTVVVDPLQGTGLCSGGTGATVTQAKFCNFLVNADGSTFTMTLNFGTATLSALSGTCTPVSACTAIQSGSGIAFSMSDETETLISETWTGTIASGASMLFTADLGVEKGDEVIELSAAANAGICLASPPAAMASSTLSAMISALNTETHASISAGSSQVISSSLKLPAGRYQSIRRMSSK